MSQRVASAFGLAALMHAMHLGLADVAIARAGPPLAQKGAVYYVDGTAGSAAPQMKFVAVTASAPLKAGWAATAVYVDGANVPSNFGSLSISTSEALPDKQQMFALGYMEAAMTHTQIFQEVHNIKPDVFEHTNGTSPPELLKFLRENDAWSRQQVARNTADPFWRAAGYILDQFDGLLAGYTALAPAHEALLIDDFWMLNGVGDYFDLIPATTKAARKDFASMTDTEVKEFVFKTGHCSALIKLLGDFSNVYFSHASWWSYRSMIRMMKHYKTPLHDAAVASKRMSFSSYPGFLESLDDFYILGSGLVMLQTTNSLFDQSLYDSVTPQSILAWQRVRIASLLGTDGMSWHKYMGQENSGTYENMYMVLDFNRYTPNTTLPPATLVVGEQIPGHYVYTDVTPQLAKGYWPSYNVPYHDVIYNLSGYPAMAKRLGTDLTYELAPRAKIFRRDQGKVTDLTSFKRIMRYNDFQHDPYSNDDAAAAICARGDLGSRHDAGGCLDAKVSDFYMAQRYESHVVNGPTSTASSFGPGQAPFTWSQFPDISIIGQPTTFNFTFAPDVPLYFP